MSLFNRLADTITSAASAKFDKTIRGAADKDYDNKRANFIRHRKNLMRLQRSIKEFQTAADAMSRAQFAITKNLSKVMGEKECKSDSLYVAQEQFSKSLQDHTKQLGSSFLADTNAALDAYLAQFSEMQRRMDEWKSRDDNVWEAERNMKQLEQKNLRTTDSKANLDDLRAHFAELNEEIKRDVPILLADKKAFCQEFIPVLAAGQMSYFAGINTGPIAQIANGANSHRARNHPHVITPSNSSAAHGRNLKGPTGPNVTYATPPPSYSGSTPPPSYGGPTLPAKPQSKQVTARALYDFNASETSELSFRAGETLLILEQSGPWWQAQNSSGKRGTVPNNYLQLC